MADILIYWRNYRHDMSARLAGRSDLAWHSKARLFAELAAGDRLWLVTSGRALSGPPREAPQAGFLVGVWQVREVMANPGDDPAYPAEDFSYRIISEPSASMLFDEPVLVDHIVRPEGRDRAKAIGSFLQGPRKLKDEKVRLLRVAAGPAMARHYLAGRQ